MRNILLAAIFFTGSTAIGQTPATDNLNWQTKWTDDFKTMTKTSNTPTIYSYNYIGRWEVTNRSDHGGEPQVFLDQNTVLGHDPGNSSDLNNYLLMQVKKEDNLFNSSTCPGCKEYNHHYSSGQVMLNTWNEDPTSHPAPQYGYIEANIKMSDSYGTFPALWIWTESNIGYMGGNTGKLYSSGYGTPLLGSSSQISSVSQNLNSICFTNLDNGYVVGNSGTVLKTADASTTHSWAAQSIAGVGTTNLNAVSFINADYGYIAGDNGKIFWTNNASTTTPTWSTITISGNPNLRSIHFPYRLVDNSTINTKYGYITGDNGTILKTYDGVNWTAQTSGVSGYSLKSVFCTDGLEGIQDGTCYAVGGNGSSGILLNTSNGGTTWTYQTLGSYNLNCIFFADKDHGYIAGDHGVIYANIRTGTNWSGWQLQSTPTTNNLKSIASNGNTLYVVGQKGTGTIGTVLTSQNDGSGTWTQITNTPANNIPAVDLNFVYRNDDYDEVDIFEMVPGKYETCESNPKYGTYLTNHDMTCNMWTGWVPPLGCSQNVGDSRTFPGGVDYTSAFHKYAVEWSPSKIVYYFDNQVLKSIVNPTYQSATKSSGMISQKTNIIIDFALSNYVKYNDYTDWKGKGAPGVPAQVTASAGFYDPNYGNYDDYYKIEPGVGTASLQYPYPYPGYQNPTSVNTTPGIPATYPYMLVDYVKYYKLDNSQCSTGSPTYTQLGTTTNSYDLNSYGRPQKTITINNSTNGGLPVTITPTSPNNIRASESIEINGDFVVPGGSELYLDISECY